jgi:hypothetical protein
MRVFVRIALESCLIAGAAVLIAALHYALRRALKSQRERRRSERSFENYPFSRREQFRRPFFLSRIDD